MPFNRPAVQVDDDKTVRRQILITDTARLYDNEPLLPVNPGNIAPSVEDKSLTDQLLIGLQNGFSQIFQHS